MQLIRRGDSGPAVAEIRAAMITVGILKPDDNPDSNGVNLPTAVFDEKCELAVREFQQHRGLTVDGVVGAETYRALTEAHWQLGDRVLRRQVSHPMVGDDVRALQERLLEMGYNAGRPDGIFGARTEDALRDFQRDYGLWSDGGCGPMTLRAFRQLGRKVVGGRPQLLREITALTERGPHLPGKKIVIDPGHGGEDRGAEWGELYEASIVWDIAARLEGRLMTFGVTPYLTRGAYNTRTDAERVEFANGTGADLLLSLHVDAHRSPVSSGVATYHFGAGSTTTFCGEEFARLVHAEVVARTGMGDGRTHAKTWDLLRLTTMPAARVELGYLTNPEDRAKLADPNFRDIVAEALLVAIQRLHYPPEMDPDTGQLIMPIRMDADVMTEGSSAEL